MSETWYTTKVQGKDHIYTTSCQGCGRKLTTIYNEDKGYTHTEFCECEDCYEDGFVLCDPCQDKWASEAAAEIFKAYPGEFPGDPLYKKKTQAQN